jgi:hypothetical protein
MSRPGKLRRTEKTEGTALHRISVAPFLDLRVIGAALGMGKCRNSEFGIREFGMATQELGIRNRNEIGKPG